MGTLFEELVRRFNEANNEEAGEHWTPRDVVELMADLVFAPIATRSKMPRTRAMTELVERVECSQWHRIA